MKKIISFLFFMPLAQASQPFVLTSTQFDSENGETGITQTQRPASSQKTTSTALYSSGTVNKEWLFRAQYGYQKSDYNRVKLTQRNGIISKLSDRFNSPEHVAKFGVEYSPPHTLISLDIEKNISPSPYSALTISSAGDYSFESTGSKLSLSLSYRNSRQPEDYFVNPDNFSTQVRPQKLHQLSERLLYSQILSERWKNEFGVASVQRPQDRPFRLGADYKLIYAPWDWISLQVAVGLIREFPRTPLKDERGYFSAYWIDYSSRQEWTSAITTELGYSTVLETETARGTNGFHRVGSDVFWLKLKYSWKVLEVGFNAQALVTNTSYNSQSVGGSLKWSL